MLGMSTQRTTHLELLAELRTEAERLQSIADHMRRSSSTTVADAADREANAAWCSYYELRAGTQ